MKRIRQKKRRRRQWSGGGGGTGGGRGGQEEEAIGMRIGCIAYDSYQKGFSRRMFEKEILKATLNGCDMGDYNNSHFFL